MFYQHGGPTLYWCSLDGLVLQHQGYKVDKVSASQPRDRGFESHSDHDHDSSYDTSTGWFQEADSRVINISC